MPHHASLVDRPIDPATLLRVVADPAAGATTLFLGTVRNTERCWPPFRGARRYCATPKSLSNIQPQIRYTTETGRIDRKSVV